MEQLHGYNCKYVDIFTASVPSFVSYLHTVTDLYCYYFLAGLISGLSVLLL